MKFNEDEIKIYSSRNSCSANLLCLLIISLLLISSNLSSQQIADTLYDPVIYNPAYPPGNGSVIFIDEGHCNFHTKDGRYKPFAHLLERDGYLVEGYKVEFTAENLAKGEILVIANALNEINESDWFRPTPSAFSKEEINVVKDWVAKGGSLFLIADHMPFAGAAEDLASVFGIRFTNGFAADTANPGPAAFDLVKGTLVESIITSGRDTFERVKEVVTFTGQAFQQPEEANPVLIFEKGFFNLLPDTAWQFNEKTPMHGIEGWSQGAFMQFGEGRIAVFGEAAMFTAQLAGPEQVRIGMNSDFAPDNYKLLLNVIHWLDRKL